MQKNDIILQDGRYFRILALKDDMALVIDCVKRNMPAWIDVPLISGSTQPRSEIYSASGIEYEPIETMSPARMKKAYERLSMVSGIAACIDDKIMYTALINKASKQYGISKQSIRSYLCDYLAFQDPGILAPKEAVKERELTEDEKNFRWAINKYYMTQDQNSLQYAYRCMLRDRYVDNSGMLVDSYPKYNRFYYYFRKHVSKQNILISRKGVGEYMRNHRPKLGSVHDFSKGCIGIGQLDGTVLDIYAVNEAGEIIGRPILTACIDTETSICMGYHLSLESGVYALRNLMLNVIADKKEYCGFLGINIEVDDWPCHELPGEVVDDRGGEYLSANFEQLTDLGLVMTELDAFRPDQKPLVEAFFNLVQGYFRQELKHKGIVLKDFGERTAFIDYRKEACLTLKEIERIIVECILYYNNERILESYPFTEEMMDAGIRPTAAGVWNYKHDKLGSRLIEVDKQRLALTLLPRCIGHFSQKGLSVNGLRYHCAGFNNEYLGGGECTVAYTPDDASRVWLHDPDHGTFTEFALRDTAHAGKSLQDVVRDKKRRSDYIGKAKEGQLQAQIDLSESIKATADTHEAAGHKSVKGIRANRKKEAVKGHKEIGGEIE